MPIRGFDPWAAVGRVSSQSPPCGHTQSIGILHPCVRRTTLRRYTIRP